MQSTVGVGFLYWGAMGEEVLRAASCGCNQVQWSASCGSPWLPGALLLLTMAGCRLHTLDDGVYGLAQGEILRDDCGLADAGVLGTATLRTEGNEVSLSLSRPELRLVGIYRYSVEEMTLDGTLTNYSAVLQGRDCLLDTVDFHVDTVTTNASSFTGAMSINYNARQPDSCACKFWFKFSGQRQ